ncbi:MAG TPA: hypothetical protein VM925_31585 [Labilithrix sp.]|nr:hypothetical protein [Labilithrix sp.]
MARRTPYVITGIIGLLLACDRDDNYREDVISCEEAVHRRR